MHALLRRQARIRALFGGGGDAIHIGATHVHTFVQH